MKSRSLALGYVLLYVKDVAASLAFYEKAFGLKRRFLAENNGYGELETGATRLGFVALGFAKTFLKKAPISTTPKGTPLAAEIGFTTTRVVAAYNRAVKAGARAFFKPEKKPWGQTVSYVRDPDGHLIEICTPMG